LPYYREGPLWGVRITECSLPKLLERLEDRGIEREETIKALRKIGDSRAIPPLISLLTDENFRVKVLAATALKDMTGYYSGKPPTIFDKLLHLLLRLRYRTISKQELEVFPSPASHYDMKRKWLYIGSAAGFHYLNFIEDKEDKSRYRIKESELSLDYGFPYSIRETESLSVYKFVILDGSTNFSISEPHNRTYAPLSNPVLKPDSRGR